MRRKNVKSRLSLEGAALVAVLSMTFTAIGLALPQPLPDPAHPNSSETEVVKLTVDSRSTSGPSPATIVNNLPAGRYTIWASGVFSYGGATRGDAECTLSLSSQWVRDANPVMSALMAGDWLDLYLDGKAVEWTPTANSISRTPAKGIFSPPTPECDSSESQPTTTMDLRPQPPHQYFTTLNWGGGNLRLNINDQDGTDNLGVLTVSIKSPSPRSNEELLAVLPVPTDSPAGVYTPDLVVGETYRFEVSGSYQFTADPKDVADAECWKSGTSGWSKVHLDGLDTLDLGAEDGTPNSGADGNINWTPLTGPGGAIVTDSSGNKLPAGSCNTQSDSLRTYEFSYTARDPGGMAGRNITRLNLKMIDTWGYYFDNKGILTVKVFHVGLLPSVSIQPNDPKATVDSAIAAGSTEAQPVTRGAPPPPGAASAASGCGPASPTQPCADLFVDSTNPAGISSASLPAGDYVIEASGTYTYYKGSSIKADAECSRGNLANLPDSSWQRYRYAQGAPGDPLDLYVAGSPVEWRAKGQSNPLACQDESMSDPNSTGHIYTLDYAHSGGAISFSIVDPTGYLGPAANEGSLRVKIFKAPVPSQLVGVVTVDSVNQYGAFTPPLLSGKRYRFEVTGRYTYYQYAGPGYEADAECSSKGTEVTFPAGAYSNYGSWTAHRFDDVYGGDPLDLYVANEPARWIPKVPYNVPETDPKYGCSDGSLDPSHTYALEYLSSSNQAVNLRIMEFHNNLFWYTDNLGLLTVKIYLLN